LKSRPANIDWFIFGTTVTLLLLVCGFLVYSEQGGQWVSWALSAITGQLGVVYIWAGIATIVFLLVVAFGQFGEIVLGPPAEAPQFSSSSWASMLFAAGIGSTVMYWGAIEWAHYFQTPPFGVEPGSPAAAEWAASYGIFHWSIAGWALYCLPSLPIAFVYHVKGLSHLRLSTACQGVLGPWAERWPGRVIDLFFMISLIGAASTGIGLSVPLISEALTRLTAWPENLLLKIWVMLTGTALFAISVYLGLEKGIKRLSLINTCLVFVFLAFVLIAGPTLFILKTGTNSIGVVLQNFFRMMTWTDPVRNSGFVESWTVFYWAWWIALGPFVGMFIAKISRGRTIRQVVFGTMGYGSLGCMLVFVILGNYALDMQLTGRLDIVERLNESDGAVAVIDIVISLPLSSVVLPLFGIICFVFMATTYDSASYTLAASASRRLVATEEPGTTHRVFWAFALGALPIALVYLGEVEQIDFLEPVKTAAVVASLPLLIVYVLLAWSLLRMLAEGGETK
jgi:BCCT family betaine/carnitine transporter